MIARLTAALGSPAATYAAALFAVGWLVTSAAVAYRFGWWWLPVGFGTLAMLAGGVGLVVEMVGAYMAPGAEEAKSEPAAETGRNVLRATR